jgi:hypothetical protein
MNSGIQALSAWEEVISLLDTSKEGQLGILRVGSRLHMETVLVRGIEAALRSLTWMTVVQRVQEE